MHTGALVSRPGSVLGGAAAYEQSPGGTVIIRSGRPVRRATADTDVVALTHDSSDQMALLILPSYADPAQALSAAAPRTRK